MFAISVLVSDAVGALIDARVASGEYASVSDYVSDLILRDQPLSAEVANWLEDFDASRTGHRGRRTNDRRGCRIR